jgi:Kef-type K+ transport system membrane component KefB
MKTQLKRPSLSRVVGLTMVLVMLFGITFVSSAAEEPSFPGAEISVLLGFVLLIANIGGVLASSSGLPRLTGFLVVGILAGPSVLGLVSAAAVQDLQLIDQFALALIALLAGSELKLDTLRPQAKPILLTTLFVTVVVWIGITGLILAIRPIVPFLAELPLSGALGIGLLLGIWAANSSPDLTVAVIEESGSHGVLSEVILGITIVKDVVVIVLFTLTLALIGPLLDPDAQFSPHVLVDLGREVGGALVVGGIAGWLFSLYLGDATKVQRSPMATFLFAYLIVVVAERLHIELLLTGVAAGFVIENWSPAGDRMLRGIESVAVVIFAFFFAVAGARLDLGALRAFGVAALLIFLGRLWLTKKAATWGLGVAGADARLRERTWQGLISQGGVTLGLLLLIQEAFPTVGADVVALGMAVIIGNILGGPILLKRALSEPEPVPTEGEVEPASTGT